ncbi:MAG: tripartite tricarboxylate transporter substrate binding protein [Betaproteobacteria bacterium]|nr:tripartite tricarboxylate transporter substrate binding protein [Betaproteobacteria bacterium]
MENRMTVLSAARAAIAALVLIPLAAGSAAAQWQPDKRVEIIVPSSTGGGNDRIGRLMQSIMQKEKLVDAVTTVVNKPGAGMALGMAYLNQHPGDAHHLLITSVGFLTNHITGRSEYSHRDVTPVALLFEEYVAFAVRPDSRIKTGKDLMAALKSDAGSASTAMASAGGNHNHMALAAVTRHAGGDLKKLKIVVYGSGGKAMAAALGGHVDLVVAPAATLLSQSQQGLLRMIAITAPKRQAGALAEVPTWREQGANAVISNWRVILAPRGASAQQTGYWENVLARLVEAAEWKEMLEKNVVTGNFLRSGETRKFLDEEYKELQVMLDALGLVKKK